MPRLNILLSAAATLAATTTLAQAHATWIAQQNGDYAVIHGEGSASNEAYDPAIVSAPQGRDSTGAPLAITLVPGEKSVTLTGTETAAVLTAVYAEGWWTEDAAGEWHNAPADAFPDFVGTGEYFTYPVAYLAPLDAPGQPIGHPVEIVPQTDPTTLTMGDKFEVVVLHDGKPVPGVVVTLDVLTDWDMSSPATDADGKTMITVQNNGLNVLQYYHETATGDKAVLGQQAVLSFVAGGPIENAEGE
jgi:nickel transport protein